MFSLDSHYQTWEFPWKHCYDNLNKALYELNIRSYKKMSDNNEEGWRAHQSRCHRNAGAIRNKNYDWTFITDHNIVLKTPNYTSKQSLP